MMKKILLAILMFLVVMCGVVLLLFPLKEIRVTGCEMSSEEAVVETVKNMAPCNNTLLLYLKVKMKGVDDIPFVSKVNLSFDGRNKVVVEVYEKSTAGCFEYMEHYIYFDKNGIVLDTSDKKNDKVPCIRGLDFENWERGEKLPLEDKKKFDVILKITQLIDKYDLGIDEILFTSDQEIVVMCNEIEVQLGDGNNISVQLMNLKSILEGLGNKKGVLYMKDFNSSESTATFKEK